MELISDSLNAKIDQANLGIEANTLVIATRRRSQLSYPKNLVQTVKQ